MKLLAACTVAAGIALSSLGPVAAEDGRIVNVQFKSGATGAIIHDSITGYEYVLYRLNARSGQFLRVSLDTDSGYAGFNVYVPGKGPGDEALYNTDMGGSMEYYGQLYLDGVHTVDVFLNRAGARQGRTAYYDISFEISAMDGSVSSSGSISAAESTCLAAVAKELELSAGDVWTISVDESEAGTSVLVQASTAEQPWNCVYDNGSVVNLMYMGEG